MPGGNLMPIATAAAAAGTVCALQLSGQPLARRAQQDAGRKKIGRRADHVKDLHICRHVLSSLGDPGKIFVTDPFWLQQTPGANRTAGDPVL